MMEAGKLIELGTLEQFRQRYGKAITIEQTGDRLEGKFVPNKQAANSYWDSLTVSSK
ncbi:hypothetical protein IQ255_15105 [Pleurocapsales cyanobacterium LEGE 10410]|nr:hypothetical protein [Pleurocapsales cyanobacterium LEGE 10410]